MFKNASKITGKVSVFLGILIALVACDDRDTRDEVFYFVMPDRFSNGDTKNDTGGIEGTREEHGFDASSQAHYHGGDLKGLTRKLPYLHQLGVTSIWMTPIFKNQAVSVDGTSAAYHGYWIQDYTQVDPHLGTNEELRNFIALAHAKGIKVFFDIVINHTADTIRYDECHAPDGSYPDGVFTCVYRDTSQAPYTPFVPDELVDVKVPSWLNDPAFYHNRGDSNFGGESSLLGDFFGLDDLNTSDPVVVEGMIDIFKFWIQEYGINGFRLDTVKHVEIEFWQQWAPAIKDFAAKNGDDNFFIFGEVFDGNPRVVSRYTTEGEIDSAVDFGLYFAMRDVFAFNDSPSRLASMFADDDLYTDANSNAETLLTFAGNHDIGRLGHHIRSANPDESDVEHLARLQLAYSLMYFGRGIPVIYYGDEQGFVGGEGDQLNREDMMPSQVESFNALDLIGTDASTADANFDTQHPMYTTLVEYKNVLDAHPALRQGKQHIRFAANEPGVLALSRVYMGYPSEYLVLINTSTEEKSITLESTADVYARLLPAGEEYLVDNAGSVEFTVPALSTRIYKAEDMIEGSALDTFKIALDPGQRVLGDFEVPVDMTWLNDAPIALTEVEFFVSTNGEEYTSLGVDYNAPYRAFSTTGDLTEGSPLYVRAVASDQFGNSLADETQLEVGLASGIEVFFQKPEFWGEDINIYYWDVPNTPNVDWPGVPMEVMADGWYRFQFPLGATRANIIFNDGLGNQSDNLFRSGDGCFIDGEWLDTCDVPVPGISITFEKPGEWGDSVNIYYWNAEPAPNIEWPGAAMENISGNFFRFQMPADVSAANIIFNDGEGNQTADLFREGDGCFSNNTWQDNCNIPQPGLSIRFVPPATWADLINIYYWEAEPGPSVDWPGTPMTPLGDGIYEFQFADNVESANIIFNDGSAQTENLFRASDACYLENAWTAIDNCEPLSSAPGFTVRLVKPIDWADSVNIYYWQAPPLEDIAWPGVAMEEQDDGRYSFTFPEGVESTNLIFNDGGNFQTENLSRSSDGCYENAVWLDACSV